MPENNNVVSIYPPFVVDPMVNNVNMRPMPGHSSYFRGTPASYTSPTGMLLEQPQGSGQHVHALGEVEHPAQQESEQETEQPVDLAAQSPDPTEHPEVEKTGAARSISRPTDVKAEPDGEQLKLSAEVAPDEDTKKLVFHVDGKQAAVVDTTGGHVEVTIPVAPGDHEVRAFAFTGEKSGPWSESVSVKV
jgi:hypothetical protein